MLEFLKGWLAWVEAGAGEHKLYGRGIGLCLSAEAYDFRNDTDLRAGLHGYFVADKLDKSHPFNNGQHSEYVDEACSNSCHLNPRRLAWVKAKIAELEKTT